jgi:hypothetical protein
MILLNNLLNEISLHEANYNRVHSFAKRSVPFNIQLDGLLELSKPIESLDYNMFDGLHTVYHAKAYDTLLVKSVTCFSACIKLQCETLDGYSFELSLAHLAMGYYGEYELVLA